LKYFKYLLNIYLTNWISLLSILIGTVFFVIITTVFQLHEAAHSISELLRGLLFIPFFLLTYGLIPICIFIIVMIILDTICFFQKTNYTNLILLIQWVMIIYKPILWAFEYHYWLWIGLSITFFVSQFFRSKKINKIQEEFFIHI